MSGVPERRGRALPDCPPAAAQRRVRRTMGSLRARPRSDGHEPRPAGTLPVLHPRTRASVRVPGTQLVGELRLIPAQQSLAPVTTTIESWLTRSEPGSSPAAHAERGTKERVSGCSCVAGSRVSSGSIAGCEGVAPDRTHDVAIATRFVCRYGCPLLPPAHPTRPPGLCAVV